jgi:hypothetical protein
MSDYDLKMPTAYRTVPTRATNGTGSEQQQQPDFRAAIAKHRDTSLRYGISRSIDRELWEVLDGK